MFEAKFQCLPILATVARAAPVSMRCEVYSRSKNSMACWFRETTSTKTSMFRDARNALHG